MSRAGVVVLTVTVVQRLRSSQWEAFTCREMLPRCEISVVLPVTGQNSVDAGGSQGVLLISLEKDMPIDIQKVRAKPITAPIRVP